MALAARGAQVSVVNRRARITGRQNVVYAVAAGAVGNHHRSAHRSQTVIAVHVGGYLVASQAELLRKPYALVAARASVLRKVLRGHGRAGVLDVLDAVDTVAIGADGRHAVATRDSLPVDAGHEGLTYIGVALATCGRDVEFVDGRMVLIGSK